MRPSTKELLDSIAEALDTRVAPTVTDPWAASSLRSIGTLLNHLSVRVESELTILAEGNADLREVLADACDRLEGRATPSRPSMRADMEELLLAPDSQGTQGVATVELLAETSRALNEQLERLVRSFTKTRDRWETGFTRSCWGHSVGTLPGSGSGEAPLYEALAGPMF